MSYEEYDTLVVIPMMMMMMMVGNDSVLDNQKALKTIIKLGNWFYCLFYWMYIFYDSIVENCIESKFFKLVWCFAVYVLSLFSV